MLSIVARLAPGATASDAARQIGAIAQPQSPRVMSLTPYARLVFREAIVPTAAGLALGFYALFLINRIARTFVYGVPAPDAITLGSASAILLALIVAAACPPLGRALRVSPSVALRTP